MDFSSLLWIFFLRVMVYTVQWFLYKLLVNDIVIIIITNYELHECLDLETIVSSAL